MRGGYGSKVSEVAYTTLRHDVVRVALAEPSALEEIHHISLTGTLLVQAVLVLLETNCTAENDLVAARREPVV